MDILQSPLFEKKVKKSSKQLKEVLNQAIKQIAQHPEIGSEKKGDLQGIRVYKFKFNEQQYLLAYRCHLDTLQLITLDSHQNFYRDLKNYL